MVKTLQSTSTAADYDLYPCTCIQIIIIAKKLMVLIHRFHMQQAVEVGMACMMQSLLLQYKSVLYSCCIVIIVIGSVVLMLTVSSVHEYTIAMHCM